MAQPTTAANEEGAMDAQRPPEQMNRMLTGYWISQALYVAAKLGVADPLRPGSLSAQALAQAAKTHALSLYRMLRDPSEPVVWWRIQAITAASARCSTGSCLVRAT